MENEDWKSLREWRNGANNKISIGKKFDYQSKGFPDIFLFTKHGKEYLPKIFSTIRKHDPDIFIELGTFQGGLTLAIHEEFPYLKIYSFDKGAHCNVDTWDKIFNKNVEIFLEDVLSKPNKRLLEIMNKDLDKKIFLYCDNGNKTIEITTYSKYLKVGDVIGCHDWLVEVNPENVKKALENFELYYSEEWKRSFFLSRFWIKVKDSHNE